ncbi:MAG: phosphatase PAP2 family protein [Clostridia bacterium]|nr:phosphatase PAP2 family protein [Clostridia bacterium]
MTNFALWLDSAFHSFDLGVLRFYNGLALKAGNFLTPLMNFISFFGKGGIFSIIFTLTLILFAKTRNAGLTGLIAFLIGVILVNVILKPLVLRARPYTHSEINEWWQLVGANTESDYSFPSGHVSAFTTALLGTSFALKNKKWLFLTLPCALLMAVSRNYLMMHYATDVLASFITSTIAIVLALLIVKLIYKKLENTENKFTTFMLTASIVNLFKKKEKTEK